jgi:hypothetical protein
LKLVIKDNLDKKLLPELIEFMRVNHGTSHVMTHEIMIDYYFYNKDIDAYNLLVAMVENKIIGILGFIPTVFRWYDGKSNEVQGAWTSHWTVDVSYRKGPGVLLMRRLQELYPIVAGHGANELNKSIVTKMGHRFLDNMERSVKVYDWLTLNKVFPNKNLQHLNPENLNKYHNSFDNNLQKVEVLSEPTSLNYNPNWSLYKYYNYGTDKSFQYIEKKYIDHPIFDYQFLFTSPQDKPCLLVFRLEQTSGASTFTCVRIVEVIIPDVENSEALLRALFARLDQFCLEKNVVFADFYCTFESIHREIQLFGFVPEHLHVLPNLLNPILQTTRDQNVELYLRDLQHPGWNEIYFTKSDGDQDRPNTNNLLSLEINEQCD